MLPLMRWMAAALLPALVAVPRVPASLDHGWSFASGGHEGSIELLLAADAVRRPLGIEISGVLEEDVFLFDGAPLAAARLERRAGGTRRFDRVLVIPPAATTAGPHRLEVRLTGRASGEPAFADAPRLAPLDELLSDRAARNVPQLAAAVATASFAVVALLFFARDPRRRDLGLYALFAIGVSLFLASPLPVAARTPRAVERGLAEWSELVRAQRGHPCVAGWIPLNESWGVQGIADRTELRSYARALVEATRALDPTRPVVGNDGWEIVGGDLVCIHDYDQDPAALAARYRDAASIAAHLDGWSPMAGPHVQKRMLLDPPEIAGRPVLVSEFGGVGLTDDPAAWGYSMARDPADLVERYAALCRALVASGSLSGFCYTQLTDTYQERNGLLRMDRTPKAPLEHLVLATAGVYRPARPHPP